MVTHASRLIGLRGRSTPSFPAGPSDVQPAPSFPAGPSVVTPFPAGPSDVAAVSGQRRGAEITTPLAPWDNAMPGTNSGPGGIGGDYRYPTQQVDERLLPVSAVTPASSGGLGTVLSKAVAPTPVVASRAAPVVATPIAPPPASSAMFTTIDRPNSSPTDRFRGGGTALNLSGLFGGAAPTPQPAAQVAAAGSANGAPAGSQGARGRQAPDMTGITFDANGNPIPDFPVSSGLQSQNPDQLGGTVGRAGWWKSLRR